MTLAALHSCARIALVIPVARGPVVVLILQLHPPHAIYFLIDELLMAGRAVFGFFIHALAKAVVLRRPGANQEIPGSRSESVIGTPLPEIFSGLPNGVVCVPLNIGLLNRMTGQARDALVVAL